MKNRSCQEVFDQWALDYHAQGMESGHWPSVQKAFDALPEVTNGNYLEIGIGNGYAIEHMATHQFASGQCCGIDVSQNMIDTSSQRLAHLKNVSLECADLMSWQPPDNKKFDLIFSMEAFYYLADIKKALERCFGFLKPQGKLLVMVNFFQEHQESHDWPEKLNVPMQLWSASQYKEAFGEIGFEDIGQEFFKVESSEDDFLRELGTLGTWGIKA